MTSGDGENIPDTGDGVGANTGLFVGVVGTLLLLLLVIALPIFPPAAEVKGEAVSRMSLRIVTRLGSERTLCNTRCCCSDVLPDA